jgi:hypothetical protein
LCACLCGFVYVCRCGSPPTQPPQPNPTKPDQTHTSAVTGRKGRFVQVEGGGLQYQARNADALCSLADINIREKHLFNKGRKLVAVISEAGACRMV